MKNILKKFDNLDIGGIFWKVVVKILSIIVILLCLMLIIKSITTNDLYEKCFLMWFVAISTMIVYGVSKFSADN